MTKPTANPLPALVQSFFTRHLIAARQLSPCTVASYRDTFRLLLGYGQTQTHRSAAQQRLEDWDAPHILGFLDHLEKQCHCCARSRNARLAAIHCFMRFVAQQEPQHLALAGRVLAIPNKRQARPLLGYLSTEQVHAILQAPAPYHRHASASGGRGHHNHCVVARTRKPPHHSPIHRGGPGNEEKDSHSSQAPKRQGHHLQTQRPAACLPRNLIIMWS